MTTSSDCHCQWLCGEGASDTGSSESPPQEFATVGTATGSAASISASASALRVFPEGPPRVYQLTGNDVLVRVSNGMPQAPSLPLFARYPDLSTVLAILQHICPMLYCHPSRRQASSQTAAAYCWLRALSRITFSTLGPATDPAMLRLCSDLVRVHKQIMPLGAQRYWSRRLQAGAWEGQECVRPSSMRGTSGLGLDCIALAGGCNGPMQEVRQPEIMCRTLHENVISKTLAANFVKGLATKRHVGARG